MTLTRRGLFRALLGFPVAAAIPVPTPAAQLPRTLAEINAFTLKHMVPLLTDSIFRESPLFVKTAAKSGGVSIRRPLTWDGND